MIAIITTRVAPRQITESDHVCHACWLRTQREVRRNSIVDETRSAVSLDQSTASGEQQENVSRENTQRQEDVLREHTSIVLPEYRRAANSSTRCVFPDCTSTPLRSISDKLRAIVLNNHNFYLPKRACVCDTHMTSNMWETLFESENRGFRDRIDFLEGCGYKAYMPESLLEGEFQLTTEQANRSRCVTICRWVVEAVNGHFKRDFKLFRQEYFHLALPHMMENFRIAAALLNRFGICFQDNIYANEILEIIRQKINTTNILSDMVRVINLNRRSSLFESINVNADNLSVFPTLEYRDLILFALGTYQIRQARSYYGEHVRSHGGCKIEVCCEGINTSQYGLRGSGETTLIRGKIKSRHVSRKTYFVYIVIQNNIPGRTGILDYCCNCLVGRRTVGCCAHVMTLVWYIGWARHQPSILAPAEFLDEIVCEDDEDEEI